MRLTGPRRPACSASPPRPRAARQGLAAIAAAVFLGVLTVAAPAPAADTRPPSIERVGLAGLLGSDLGSEAQRRGKAPAGLSGAFVYRNGSYTPLGAIPGAAPLSDVPGFPDVTSLSYTFAINSRGETAGTFTDAVPGPDGTVPPGSSHGFVRSRRGDVTSFDVPGAAEVLVKGNDNRGRVVGEYIDAGAVPRPDGLLPPRSTHGFIRRPSGRITTFDVPFRYLHDIGDVNDRGQLVGYYDDPGRPYNLGGGFLREPDGEIIRIDVPRALSTEPHCINDKGEVVGSYVDAGARLNPDGTIPPGIIHGFVWDRGRYRRFDPGGSVYTLAAGCNDRGQITGGYQDAAGKQHGFLLSRGRTTTLDAPGRVDNIAWGINDRGDVIVPEGTVRLAFQAATD
jgi:hypothetical protein